MFSSILQMMGFPATKPLHSRAKEKTAARADGSSAAAAGAPSKTRAPTSPPQEQPPRRSTVKSALKATPKAPIKSAPAVKSAKSPKVDKAVKPVKPVKVTKAVATAVATKVQPKRSVAAPAGKASVSKPAQARAKQSSDGRKAVSHRAGASIAPPPPHPSHKKTESVTRVVDTKPVSLNAEKSGKSDKKSVVIATVANRAEPSAAATSAAATGVPPRSSRPSSRLAQLTVPSMAQSVASNAAKASFTQITSPTPIASPVAASVKKDPKLANNWKKKAVAELTDEEVIAMPDQEYMNEIQMAFFRQKLVNLKDAILNNAGETTEHLREDTVVVPDPADRATIEEEHALELRTRDRERKLLKKIEQSINRIDAGDYGYCDETGEPIGVARLLARPTATLSLEAQQRRELKQKMFGD